MPFTFDVLYNGVEFRTVTFKVSVEETFSCNIERAFKAPMLSDVAKVHTGYGLMPPITHATHDADWGKPGSTKKVYAAASITQRGGFISMDKVIERIENKYWKIEVYDFQSWMLGFHKFTGEWVTQPIEKERTKIIYTYTLHANGIWFYPLNWLFAHVFWKKYMRRVLSNVRNIACGNEAFLYDQSQMFHL